MRRLLLALVLLAAAAQARAEIDSGIDWEPLLSPSFVNQPDAHPYGHAGSACTPEAQPMCAKAANASEGPEHNQTDLFERLSAASMWALLCLLVLVSTLVRAARLIISQSVAGQDAAPDDTVQHAVAPHVVLQHDTVVHEMAQRKAQPLERRAHAPRTDSASAQPANRLSEQAADLDLDETRACLFASAVPLPHEETAIADDGATETEEQDETQPYYPPEAAVCESASVCAAADQAQSFPFILGQEKQEQEDKQGQQETVDMEEDAAEPGGKDQAADIAEEGSGSRVADAGTPSTTCSFLATSSTPPSAPASRDNSPAVVVGSKRKRAKPDRYEGFLGFGV